MTSQDFVKTFHLFLFRWSLQLWQILECLFEASKSSVSLRFFCHLACCVQRSLSWCDGFFCSALLCVTLEGKKSVKVKSPERSKFRFWNRWTLLALLPLQRFIFAFFFVFVGMKLKFTSRSNWRSKGKRQLPEARISCVNAGLLNRIEGQRKEFFVNGQVLEKVLFKAQTLKADAKFWR